MKVSRLLILSLVALAPAANAQFNPTVLLLRPADAGSFESAYVCDSSRQGWIYWAVDSESGAICKDGTWESWPPGAGGSGDISAVGDCSSGSCFQSEAARHVLAAPAGGGQASFRTLVEDDVSDLAHTTDASDLTSGTIGAARLPAATTSAQGAVVLSTDGESTAGEAIEATDSRLSDSRTPSGSAGGDLSGTYPSPTIAADAVGLDEMAACSGPGEIVEYGASGVPTCVATPSGGGGGSAHELDFGDTGTAEVDLALSQLLAANDTMHFSLARDATKDRFFIWGSPVAGERIAQFRVDSSSSGSDEIYFRPAVTVGSDLRSINADGFRFTSFYFIPRGNDTNTYVSGDNSDTLMMGAGGTIFEMDVSGALYVPPQASAPLCSKAGLLYVPTAANKICICDGASWVVADGSDTSC